MLGIVTGGIYQAGSQSLSTNADNVFSEFQGLGAKWIRIEANWAGVDGATYQNIVRKAHNKGLKVIVLLTDSYTSGSIDDFTKQYVSKLNTLVNQVFVGDATADAIEITNEPNQVENTPTGFRVGGNAFAYLLRRVWQWKTSNNRPEMIISGGTINTYYTEPWWNDFFKSGAWKEGPRPFDAFGVHPYNASKIDQTNFEHLDFAPWKSITKSLLVELAAEINKLTGTNNTPLYATEFGWQLPVGNACKPNTNCVNHPEQVAAGMQAAVEAFNESGVVPVALWYDYRDDSEGRYGLRQQWDGQRYPAKPQVWQKFKSLAGGTGSDDPESYWFVTPTPTPNQHLFQLHKNGEIWQYTGIPCSGNSCPGWQKLDNNPATVAIAATVNALYQLHQDGSIWQYTGTPCSGNSCSGWQKLDNNPATVAIAAAGNLLYQLHQDGSIWQYTGTPCSGNSCPGWQKLDNNPATVAIAATVNALYQLHQDGSIWQYTGTPCSGNSCPGWQKLDNNPATVAITAANNLLYQLHQDGSIWQYTGTPCSGNSCPGWQKLDNNPATVAITAANNLLYQLHKDGSIWQYTGTPCSGNSCPGWQKLDNNPATIAITTADNNLYQLHKDGSIWQYTGTPCSGNSCPGWQKLDNNPATVAISSKIARKP